MASIESRLIVSLFDQLSAPSRAVSSAIRNMHSAAARNAVQLDAMRGRMLDAAGAGFALWKGLSAPINAAVEFETSMSNVRKVVDFDNAGSFRKMGDDIRRMSLEIPMAASGIAEIVAAAGQSGIARDELMKFAEIAAKVGVAWDIGAGQTGEALAKLKTALGLSLDDTASLADAINHLGNNSAASAPQILDVVRRVAPMAKQFGMTAEQVAAIGAAMTGAGFEAEVASTSLLNVGRALTKGTSATGRQDAVFKKLGLSAKGVAQSMQKNAVGTLQDVLQRINKLPAATRAAAISDLFGDEARALGPLISNGTLLAETLELIADKSKYTGSSSQEFNTAAQRTAFGMQIFRNRVTDLAISIGDALLPALNGILAKIGPVVTSISDLAREHPRLTSAIVATTAAVVGLRVAMTGLGFAALFLKGGLIQVGIGLLTFSRGLAGLAMWVSGVGLFKAALTGLRSAMVGYAASAAIVGHGGALSIMASSLMSALNPIRLVSAALTALKVAVISTGIGAILVGIAMAGAWIYNNWEGITQLFAGIADGFRKGLAPAAEVFRPVVDMAERVYNAISGLVGPLDASNAQWRTWGETIGGAVASGVNAVASGISRIIGLFQSAIEGARNFWSTISSWGGGDSSGPKPPNIGNRLAGKRERGGPVRAGSTYLVNERGPELFTPGRSGVISPHSAYRAAVAGSAAGVSGGRGGGGNTVHVTSSPIINIYETRNARSVAEEASRRIADDVRSSVEGAFSD